MPNVNLLLWIILFVAVVFFILVVFQTFRRDRNKQKLMFVIGLGFALAGIVHFTLKSAGFSTFLEKSYLWSFLPITFALLIAGLHTLLNLQSFDKLFRYFLPVAGLTSVMLASPFPTESLGFGLIYASALSASVILLFLVITRRDLIALLFMLTLLCYMLTGISVGRGWAEETTIIFCFYGLIFLGFVFAVSKFCNSNLASLVVDKSDFEKIQKELSITKEKLSKAEKLAAIGELALMLGHDLRNPLTSINSAAYYINAKASYKLSEKEKEMLETIFKGITRADKIINDLLEYSQDIVLSPSQTELQELIQEALESVKVPEKVQVIISMENLPNIMVDTEKLRKAFLNIIQNALDAMPDGGTLTIEGRKIGEEIQVSFTDTGIGMSSEILEKIWDPLFTTKAQGIGFGLPICKRFIEAHGGRITVKSTPGKGTTFTIFIPLKPKI
ncbi:MAG: ATP-binding protein [Nitrososphaerota archaeon]|nr:ATP-binding protein [Candidatus Bathyarchaeota archaeon]MDW8023553.1 ATP-binding protein [Nitrososphaerota archaeon]